MTAWAPSPASRPSRRPKRSSPSVLDLKLIRDQPEAVAERLAARGGAAAGLIKDLLAKDAERRRLVKEPDELKALRNRASEAIGQAKRRGDDASAEQARMREVAHRIKALDAGVKAVDEELERLLLQLPHLPHPSVPIGAAADDNREVRRWGEARTLTFTPRP